MPSKSINKLTQPTRNWSELPSDLMVNILERIGVDDILLNAQKVCTAWREICKDPVIWRAVYIDGIPARRKYEAVVYQEMCKRAVDRSQGQLLDLTIIDQVSLIRRLKISSKYVAKLGVCSNSGALKNLSLLEELSLVNVTFMPEDIEVVGRYCTLLKTLKLNLDVYIWNGDEDDDLLTMDYEVALNSLGAA
ncbi:putative F-box/LRR-repeat protein 22 [Bidens hawaiensis]|uniref:putative F-box/LRR-repeat protein 22 n=1 Tax=Bidens hawaiensis TaxID=980011 RepID=UPI00404B3765